MSPTITEVEGARHPLSHLGSARRLGRQEPRSRLLRRLRRAAHRRPLDPRPPRLDIAILLPAAKSGVPVCPGAGGVGPREPVQHLSMFDYVALSGSWEDRVIEYVDHLHEHFTAPVVIEGGRYRAPSAPGFPARGLPETIAAHTCPEGPVWRAPGAGKETGR